MSIANRAGLVAACAIACACGSPGGTKSSAESGGAASSLDGSEGGAGNTALGGDAAGAAGLDGSENAGAPTVATGGSLATDGGAPATGSGGKNVGSGGAPMPGSGGAGDAGSGATNLAGAPSNDAGAPGSGTGGTPSSGGSAGGGGVSGSSGAGGTQNGGGCQADLECADAPVGACATPFCNQQTGLCEAKSLPDDTACDDDDACTQQDTCQAGTCVGKNPVVCGPSDQCHAAGICNAFTGACSNPKKKDGSGCDDGDACTQQDSCTAGSCAGAAVVCSALDQCHDAGTCSPQTGLCTNPARQDGSSCDDGHVCTSADQCQAGICGGSAACSISVDPALLTLAPGGGYDFTATVTGVAPATVSWSIQEGATGGSIDAASGAYVAPGSLSTYHVVATSTADSALTASAPVTVTLTPVSVSLCPSHATILPDDSLLLTALVDGTGNHAVTWSATGGTIKPSGAFSPGVAGAYTITAQSVAEPAKKASASIDAVDAVLPSISGSVGYAGAKTGAIHLTIAQGQRAGTAQNTTGKYRIRGVDLQTKQPVTVTAYMDTLGTGKYSVGSDPIGTANIASFSGADTSGVNITLSDPAAVVLTAPSNVQPSPGDGFALVQFSNLRDNSGSELAEEYRIYADTSAAVGSGSYVKKVVTRAGAQSVALIAGLSDGVSYWFAVAAASGGSEGPQKVAGPIQIGAPGGGHSVSGTADFSGLSVTGPLYAIAYNGATQQLFVNSYTPAVGATTQPFSIGGLPDGSYRLGVAIDQDSDGELGPHDPLTLTNGGNHPFDIAGADLVGEDVPVPAGWAAGDVTTHYSNNSFSPYSLDFKVSSNSKLPIAAWFSGGPNAPTPADFGIELSDSSPTLRRDLQLLGAVPAQGDAYDLTVVYEDGVTCNLPVSVSGVWSTLPTLLSPVGNGNGSAIPLFSWLAPPAAPKYYSYGLGLYTAGNNNDLWRFDGPSSTTSVTYNSDGKAKQASLQEGVGYDWWLEADDRFGNSTRNDGYFTLPINEAPEPNDAVPQQLPGVNACDQYPPQNYLAQGTLDTPSDVDLFHFSGSAALTCSNNPTVTTSLGARACVWAICSKGATTFTGCAAGTQTVVGGITACCTDTAGFQPSATYGYTCGAGDGSAEVVLQVSNGTGAYKIKYHF
ncbi:MAG TPA: hypothetical protein VNG33_05745 [Polyangiaceae bacterium]|nr:hypothetical protein [Polyangiaceae bacterium]